MNNILKNQACKVSPGTVITGKWHGNAYKVLKSLGYGANGMVYLASGKNGLAALKISDNNISITSEVNVLKHFSKVQGSPLGPSLLDVDDWIRPGFQNPVPFYVMEYIKGENFLSFIEKRGEEWIGVLCLKLLTDLERLHNAGWVFGDLKPENLIVTGPPPNIRCVDVGGTTQQGRAVKEYTEFFDRGYWGLGSRKAEPSYDLFAIAMIMVNAAYPKRFAKTEKPREQLQSKVVSHSLLKKYASVILKAIDGKYQTASDMRKDLVQTMSKVNIKKPQPVHSGNASRISNRKTRQSLKKKKRSGTFETICIVILVLFAYFLYIYGELM
jgi:serine/threonine protein kinase, bacterial